MQPGKWWMWNVPLINSIKCTSSAAGNQPKRQTEATTASRPVRTVAAWTGDSRQETGTGTGTGTGIETGTTQEKPYGTLLRVSQSVAEKKKVNTICCSASIERVYICYYALSVRCANDTVRNEQHFNCEFNISHSTFTILYFYWVTLFSCRLSVFGLFSSWIAFYILNRKTLYTI